MLVCSLNSIPIFILVSFTSILLCAPDVTADEQMFAPIFTQCGSNDDNYTSGYNYTTGSQYETNLKFLLGSLVSGGSGGDGYFNTSKGVDPDIVYALAQCRGDVSMEDCSRCLTNAAADAIAYCPNELSATFRYERCLLHYSNSRVFSKNHTVILAEHPGGHIPEYTQDANFLNFLQPLKVLLNNLSETAAPRPTRYSFGATSYAPFKTVHGLVECRRDLSASDCESCLSDLISYIPKCCSAIVGARICSDTCYIRYDLDAESVLPPALAPTFTLVPLSDHPDSEESNGANGGNHLNILLIIFVIISSIMLEL